MLQLLLQYILLRHGTSTRMHHQSVRSASVLLLLLLRLRTTHQLVIAEQMLVIKRETTLFAVIVHVTRTTTMMIVRLHVFVQIPLEGELLVTVLTHKLFIQHVLQVNSFNVDVHLPDPGEFHRAELAVVSDTRVRHLLMCAQMDYLRRADVTHFLLHFLRFDMLLDMSIDHLLVLVIEAADVTEGSTLETTMFARQMSQEQLVRAECDFTVAAFVYNRTEQFPLRHGTVARIRLVARERKVGHFVSRRRFLALHFLLLLFLPPLSFLFLSFFSIDRLFYLNVRHVIRIGFIRH